MSDLFLGLMSGTSLDGIDIALTDFTNHPKLIHFETRPYPKDIKHRLTQLNLEPQISLNEFSYLHSELGHFFAEAVDSFITRNEVSKTEIKAVGSHGQTIFHAPKLHMTLQVGHPAFIAKYTQLTTIADFRMDDMANYGQGAPLAPAFHQYLFSQLKDTAVVNIGGIANISILKSHQTSGFDTGPGNGIMDEICQKYFNKPFDHNGELASQGRIALEQVDHLLQYSYFRQAAPKSTGRDIFHLDWLMKECHNLSPIDLLATANYLTAKSIALAANPFKLEKIILCGGGAENHTLINNLSDLTDAKIETTATHHISPHAIEAMMIAWLAKCRLENQEITLKPITGSHRNSVLGAIWHP